MEIDIDSLILLSLTSFASQPAYQEANQGDNISRLYQTVRQEIASVQVTMRVKSISTADVETIVKMCMDDWRLERALARQFPDLNQEPGAIQIVRDRIKEMRRDNGLDLPADQIALICYDTWRTEANQKRALESKRREFDDFLLEEELRGSNPIPLVRSTEHGVPFTFAHVDLASTDQPLDILIVTGSSQYVSHFQRLAHRMRLSPQIEEHSPHFCKLKWTKDNARLPGENGRLFKEVWWFTASKYTIKNVPMNSLYCHFSNALKELARHYTNRAVTIHCPLVGLDEDESDPQDINLRWNSFKSLLFELSETKFKNIIKIVIFSQHVSTLRLLNLLSSALPPIILHDNSVKLVDECLDAISEVAPSDSNNNQHQLQIRKSDNSIGKALRIMKYSIEAARMQCKAFNDEGDQIITHLVAGVCQSVSLNCRFIIEHLVKILSLKYLGPQYVSKAHQRTLCATIKQLKSSVMHPENLAMDQRSFLTLGSKLKAEWNEIFAALNAIRCRTNPVVHHTSLSEIASLNLYRDLLMPLRDLLLKLKGKIQFNS